MEHLKCVLLVLILGLSTSLKAEKYEYVDGALSDKESYQIDTEAEIINFGGDSQFAAHFCKGADFHCFISLRLSFAVPKGHIPKQWSYNGLDFTAKCNEVLVVLGKRYTDLCIIESLMGSRDANKKMQWYYSIKEGLIAFRAIDTAEQNLVWGMHFLTGVTGFGAKKSGI